MNIDAIIEGRCPNCDGPLERRERCGWCPDCRNGWAIQMGPDGTGTVTLTLAADLSGFRAAVDRATR